MERAVEVQERGRVALAGGRDARVDDPAQWSASSSSSAPARRASIGTSTSARSSSAASRSAAECSTTRNPRLRTCSTMPRLVSSSSASRTGVTDTPIRAASAGAEWISCGAISP